MVDICFYIVYFIILFIIFDMSGRNISRVGVVGSIKGMRNPFTPSDDLKSIMATIREEIGGVGNCDIYFLFREGKTSQISKVSEGITEIDKIKTCNFNDMNALLVEFTARYRLWSSALYTLSSSTFGVSMVCYFSFEIDALWAVCSGVSAGVFRLLKNKDDIIYEILSSVSKHVAKEGEQTK